MNQDIRYVVCAFSTPSKYYGTGVHTLPTLRTALPFLVNTTLREVSIRTYYKDHGLLPKEAGYAGVDIDIKKLKVTYSVSCVANRHKYRNYKVTYATLEDLVFSVINYLTICQETKMIYSDILTSGEN